MLFGFRTLGGSREPCIRWRFRSLHEKGQFWGGKGHSIVKYRDLYGHLCKNSWTDRDAVCVVGSDELKESCVRWGPEVLRNVAMAKIGNQCWGAICYNWLCGITLVVWMLATRCLILGVGFWGQAIWWRHSQYRVFKGCCHGREVWD